jgi:hypothetical protein
MRRHGAQHLGNRKRNVQEKTDRIGHAQLAQALRERQQVIVVDPDDVVGLEKRLQLLRERRVHAQIARVFLPVVARQIGTIVKRGPQRRVRKTAVVLVVVAAREPDRRICHIALLFDDGLARLADDLTAPSEPDPTGFLQRVENANGQTSCGGPALLRRRNAVRYHD